MKKLKHIFSCVLVCLMFALPMLSLTACDNSEITTPTTNNSETTTPTETTPTETTQPTSITLSKEQAEWTYYEALRNSSLSTERKSTFTEYYLSRESGLFEKERECQVVLKNNIYNIKNDDEISWLKDKKYYTVEDKKYYEDYNSIELLDPLEYDTTEFLKFLHWGGTFEFDFQGGKVEDGLTTVYFKVYNDDGETYTYHLSIEIVNKLISSVKLFGYDHTGHERTGYFECTMTYENVEFITTLPTDLNTYTLSTKQ